MQKRIWSTTSLHLGIKMPNFKMNAFAQPGHTRMSTLVLHVLILKKIISYPSCTYKCLKICCEKKLHKVGLILPVLMYTEANTYTFFINTNFSSLCLEVQSMIAKYHRNFLTYKWRLCCSTVSHSNFVLVIQDVRNTMKYWFHKSLDFTKSFQFGLFLCRFLCLVWKVSYSMGTFVFVGS